MKRDRTANINDCFRDAAAKVLPEKTFFVILEMAHAIKRAREILEGGSMSGWIGVDLDGTLAHYEGWIGPNHIGEPVPEMLARVKKWILDGRTVKIFTARCCVPEQVPFIVEWLDKHEIGGLEVTNVKDFGMIELWDDRCVRVVPNTGRQCCHGR